MNTDTAFDPRPAVIAELAKLGITAELLHWNKVLIIGKPGDTDQNTDHFVELKSIGGWRHKGKAVSIGHRSGSVRYKLKAGNDFNAEGAAIKLLALHAKKLQARVDAGVRHAQMDMANATLERTIAMIGGEEPQNLHGMNLDTSAHYTDKIMVKIWDAYTPDQIVRLHALLASFKAEV